MVFAQSDCSFVNDPQREATEYPEILGKRYRWFEKKKKGSLKTQSTSKKKRVTGVDEDFLRELGEVRREESERVVGLERR